VTTTVTTTTTITITPYTESYSTYDNGVQYYIDDHVMYDNGSTVDAYICTADSLGNLPTDTDYWTLVDYDNKNTTVTERTEVVGTKSGVISDDTIELSNIDVLIPAGSESDSEEEDVDPTTEYDVLHDQTVIYEPAHTPVQYYIVEYYSTDVSEWYYWLYNPELELHPSLDVNNSYVGELEMLPVITLRANTVDTVDLEGSDLLADTEAMTKLIGVDLQSFTDSINESPDIDSVEDAFIHFGVKPLDTSEVVSKALFEMFNFMYDDTELMDIAESKYFAIFQEHTMNHAMAWTSQSREVVAGVIGPIGTHNHETISTDLIMSFQGVEESYLEITVTELNSTTAIDREGLWGVKAFNVAMDNFFVPLSYHFTTLMSPIEQSELIMKSMLVSIYAATITHLEWYETEAFGNFLQIVGYVVMIIITWLTWGAASSFASFLIDMAINIAIGMAIRLALEMLFRLTDNEYLRVLGTVAVIAVSIYAGGGFDGGFANANMLTTISTSLSISSQALNMQTAEGYEELGQEKDIFAFLLETRMEEVEDTQDTLDKYLSTEYVAGLATTEINPYIESVDLMIYKAIGIQYNNDLLFSYDDKCKDYFDTKLKLSMV